MRKKIYILTAMGLLAATLFSSCVTTYSMKLQDGEGNPSFGGDFSFGEGLPPSGYTSLPQLSLPDFGDFPLSHLFSKDGYTLPEGVDFSGFTPDGNYFIADFDKGLSKYSGMGKYLFALNQQLTKEQQESYGALEAILTMPSSTGSEMYPEYVVYGVDKDSLRQIVVERYDGQGGKEAFLFDYVSSPIDGKHPEIPGLTPPQTSKQEPEQRYTNEWLEWLTVVDRGNIYPMIKDGTLYSFEYPSSEDYEPSPFSIVRGSKSSRFSLSLGLDRGEFPSTDEGYHWKVFHRKKASVGAYEGFEMDPWKWSTDGSYYRFDLEVLEGGMSPTLKTDYKTNRYEMVFIITDEKERIVSWWKGTVDWTMSSEMYLADAVSEGIAKDERTNALPLPEAEPERYSPNWFSWLERHEGISHDYPKLDGGLLSSSYKNGYSESAFTIWPYNKGAAEPMDENSRFGIALSVQKSSLDIESNRYTWQVFYRIKGHGGQPKRLDDALYGY
ncbi:MAG: hypothetical protein IJY89_01835, partial [Clostridia bacterium]|nr:hypothetical protein [Clostridia bacterium]